jgi:cell division protein FtsB
MARLRDGDGFDGDQHNADRRRPSRPAANPRTPDGVTPSRASQERANQGRANQGRANQGRAKQNGAKQNGANQNGANQNGANQNGANQGRAKQNPAERGATPQRPTTQRPTTQRPTTKRSTTQRSASRRPSTQSTKVALSLPPMESAPELWLRNIRLSGFAFTVLALVVVAVIVLAPGLRILVEQQQQIAALTAEVNAGTTAVNTYQEDVARWSDPAYIEAQAREKLYYIFPGDRTYLVVDDGETVETSDGQPISDSIQSLQVDWVQSLVASVYTAGLTDATGAELVSPSPASTPNQPSTTDGN